MIFSKLDHLQMGPLRRQLAVGMALVVASVMILFVWDFARQQEAVLIKQKTNEASSLAHTVASASAVWVASRDFSGIQEILGGLHNHPDLRYAIVLDMKGQILAHSDRGRRGLYMTDLPERAELTVRKLGTHTVEVVDPIMLSGHQVGWVRIGQGNETLDAELRRMKSGGVFFALVAIALSTLIAVLSGRYLTRRLYTIEKVANAVQAGETGLRVAITGNDEATQLSRHFNSMLDKLAQREAELSEALQNLRMITNRVPGVIVFQWRLRPDGSVCLPYVSEAFLEIFRLSPDSVRDDATATFPIIHPDDFREMKTTVMASTSNLTPLLHEFRLQFAGEEEVWLQINAMPQREADGSTLWYGFMIDVTERKRYASALQESEARFRQMFENNSSVMMLIEPSSGAIVDANAAAASFYGYSVERLKAMHIGQINTLAPDEIAAELNRVALQERNYLIFSHRLASGEVRTVEVRSNPIKVKEKVLLYSIINDITERKLMEEKIRQLAFNDALTSLPNRRLLENRFGQVMAESKRSRCYGALMYLDLDNFKQLNDSHGHGVGDLLLVEVANRLKSCVRETDTVSRLGGDEFVVLLSKLHQDKTDSALQARAVAEKIGALLSEPYTLTIGGDGMTEATVEHHCSASIGVALFIDHETNLDDILKRADRAMYQAKNAGRNLVWLDETSG